MHTINGKFSQIRGKLESTAFQIAQGGDVKAAHAEIVQALVLLQEVESLCSTSESAESPTEALEIAKVRRRLRLWAKRPDQKNARLLIAYLRLERAGSPFTKADLEKEMPDEFEGNFIQMRIIADKNHGKVFECNGDRVSLWPPIVSYIRKFEKVIFEPTTIT